MPKATTDLYGSTFYRIGFAIFIVGCLMNAVDAYHGYVHDALYGAPPKEAMYEAWAFLGLTFILVMEGAGLMLFKWVKRHAGSTIL